MASHHRATATSSWATTSSPSPPPSAARFGQPPTAKETLVAYIERACDPSLHEPNLSLDLEIADLINSKKANTPREAAVEVVRLINHRNTHVAMLALHASPSPRTVHGLVHLLDILVKNCGYPFHLQISTKEFLNELVRRFPERPPTFPPPPMKKILELVHEWKNTICVTSKHKEDLVHIRDMHRLLSYKGYRFPDFDRRAVQVLNPTENLQTPDELEEEDREAQAAASLLSCVRNIDLTRLRLTSCTSSKTAQKLQELIRRGTPKDLAAAQELMKIMAGAEPEKKPNYEAQVSKELDRVQQRVLLLNEMLNNAAPKERFVEGDAYDQIAKKCRHVQPKLQKWIADSAESNPDAMGKVPAVFLIMRATTLSRPGTGPLLPRLTQRASLDRKDGVPLFLQSASTELSAQYRLSSGGAGSKARAQAQQVSLIDFDDDDAFAAPTPPAVSTPSAMTTANNNAGPSNPLDDLASLSLGGGGVGGGLGSGQSQQTNGGGSGGSLFDLNAAFGAPAPAQQQQQQRPFGSNTSSSMMMPSWANGSASNAPMGSVRPMQQQQPVAGTFFSNPAVRYSSPSGSGSPSPSPSPSVTTFGGGSSSGLGSISLGAPAPPVPPKQQQQQQQKDAFADLLGDF
ncbi:hypothetical protein C6P46_006213 [Rhodotorula mucilaginosa]|uniref:VHS domain-containing protein n=1 Tax=Rhodotorula mucilaginosa TaxID=5537 RepID=A0A9P7B4C5_RHOMI|nr:hypothetical protein C6P46_006213 [Rhodotorula mucilaginosa]